MALAGQGLAFLLQVLVLAVQATAFLLDLGLEVTLHAQQPLARIGIMLDKFTLQLDHLSACGTVFFDESVGRLGNLLALPGDLVVLVD